ncbi:iron reductase [Suillus subaureus]|uniref:Iron reductase n=1 Tax=Suillus subaureus TaxID=48587 RepID=A0A9P7E1P6_9AGAM|nr:iron reductase [Suillus subaureus]KAG1809121.1 iron reductase [Suillus subaureus]
MAAPVVPSSFQIYDSYVEDPKWQIKFTIIWCSGVALAVAVSVPSLILGLRHGRSLKGIAGISETNGYQSAYSDDKEPPPSRRRGRRLVGAWNALISPTHWSPPKLELNLGQIVVILAYLAAVLVCIIKDAPLISNPNRAGESDFSPLAQFPVVFLFATKNSILSLLLGPGNGYEKLNFMHRMAGRAMFLAGCIHGSLWIRNHLQYGIQILGPQKETSGVASLALLCIIVLTSLRPVRRLFYEYFFVIHVLTYVAFFVTICYHTLYASPWIFPPLAFYGADVLLRLFRYRIKDATLTAQDAHMTLIRVHNCDDGWLAGQHVRLRVFFSNRVFESHALTILSATPSHSCLSSPGFLLAARNDGDWTRALNNYTRKEQERLQINKSEGDSAAFVQVMLDGPYGGSSVDLGLHESVLLIAGGSGVTFTLGLLDDIIGRCVKLGRSQGERTRRIEFTWCIRSFGQIEWFAPMLMDIATAASNSTIDLHISIFVTCLCDLEAVPHIPNSIVTLSRPSVQDLLKDFISPSPSSDREDSVEIRFDESQKLHASGGGVVVCASGPESLTREAQNAVARLGLTMNMDVGGIALHTELFTL